MRTANVLKATRQIADEALYRSSLGSGGGGSGPLPAATFTVMVNKGGNDATGDGTDEKPFLTVTKGLAVAATIAVGPGQPPIVLVLVGPGVYSENVEIPPFVFLSAEESGQTVVLGTGVGPSVTLSPGWAAEPIGILPIGGVEQNAIIGLVVADFTGVKTPGPIFIVGGGQTTVAGGLTVIGDSVNGGQADTLPGTLVGGPTNITGASLFSLGSGYSNVINVTSTAAQPASLNSSGDIYLDIAVTLNATAGQNVTASLVGTGFQGTLTLHDGGGGVTSFSATSGGIPDVVTRIGGAAAPVPLSPLIGLDSKNATGVAAAAGTVATADGASGITWSPAPGGFPISTRGLTMSLQASHGINLVSGTNHVVRWYDQAPAHPGQSWVSTAAPNPPTTGVLNGHPAVVCPFQNGQGSAFFNPVPSNVGGQLLDTVVSAQEFTVAASLLYTGSKSIAIGQDLRTVYEIFGENTGGSILEMGLAVGISRPRLYRVSRLDQRQRQSRVHRHRRGQHQGHDQCSGPRRRCSHRGPHVQCVHRQLLALRGQHRACYPCRRRTGDSPANAGRRIDGVLQQQCPKRRNDRYGGGRLVRRANARRDRSDDCASTSCYFLTQT